MEENKEEILDPSFAPQLGDHSGNADLVVMNLNAKIRHFHAAIMIVEDMYPLDDTERWAQSKTIEMMKTRIKSSEEYLTNFKLYAKMHWNMDL